MKKRVIAVAAALIMILSVLPVWESALAASCPPHKWGDWQIDTPATCTEKGRKYRVCTRCTTGFEWKDIPALGHDWKLSQTVREATCIQTGSIREKCTRCGKTRKVDTGYGDHKWGGWYEKSPGLKERDCQLCGKQEFSYSPVLEISFTEVSAPEKGFYTEGETVHYSVSVYNRGAGDATECEIILDENSSSIGTMGYHVTKTLELTYEITAEDVEAGSVSKQVTLKCREKKPVQSGTVTVKTGKEDAGPVHSTVIEVASAPAEVSAEAGTQVRVDYRITNTGETVICCTGLGAGDANGKAASLTYNDVPDILPHQVPGEPVIISVNYVVTPEDISAGYLIRIAHSVFSDFVSYDDGHVLTPEEFGHVASVTGDKSWLTDNVRIEIPLKTLSSSAVIEVISAPASVPAETGAQVRVDYRVTNTGDTVICVPGFGAVDGNNSFAPVTFNDVPDFFPAQMPGEPATISVNYTVTQEDINAGFLIRSAHAPFSCFVSYDDGHVLTPEEYKTVTSKTGDKVYLTDDTLLSIPVGGPVPVSALHLEITSFSADPSSPAGTVIAGTLKLTNTGDYALNILAGSIETAGGELLKTDYFGWFPEEAKCLTSGNSCEIGFCVEITDDDMKAGKVLRRFTMIALPVTLEEAPEYVRSNTETGIIELSITKALHIELTSFSADEIHIPETVITGTLEVTNLSDIPLKIIAGSIENDLGEKLGTDYFHWFPPEADCLAPGESCTIIFYVSPVKHDADRQEILRDFTMIALPAEDDMSTDYVISNTVRGIIKITGPLPVFSGLKITKAEISKPEKDGYYREGEEVSYLITVTNTGDTAITGLTVYDSLKQENLGIIGEADVLNPSGSLQFTYTYRVSDFDVERGYVDNCARAEYTDDDFKLEVSNTVRVDTDGIPDDPVAPVIAPVKPNRPVPEDPGDPDDKTGKGCFADYTGDVPALSFCAGHQETENAAKAVSGSPADVRAIWKQALDEEYAEYLSRSNGPAMIIVLTERARFSAFLTAREQTLKQLYPDDPAKVDSIIAEMMREKVVVMCHELHTAPAPRGGFSLRVNGTSLSAFLAGMDRVYDTSAGICPADAAFFSAWLDARREMLDILWPGDPVEAQMALEQDVLNNTRMLNDMMQ